MGGKEASAEPNREIGCGFVSCSCCACVRAKLRERGREVLLNAGGSNGKTSDSGAECSFCVFDIIRLGFKANNLQRLRKAMFFLNIPLSSLLFALALRKLLDASANFDTMRMEFKRFLEMLPLYSWALSNKFYFQGPYQLVEHIVSTVELNRSYQQII